MGVCREDSGWTRVELRQGIGDPAARRGGARHPTPTAVQVELGAYWLLYLVAVPASWLHWLSGASLIALACAGVVLMSVHLMTRVWMAG